MYLKLNHKYGQQYFRNCWYHHSGYFAFDSWVIVDFININFPVYYIYKEYKNYDEGTKNDTRIYLLCG